MYVDSSPVTQRRSTTAPRRRNPRRAPTAAARRTRLADAIVSQWLLEQVPSDHRLGESNRRREVTV
jgi:hypothetical protein